MKFRPRHWKILKYTIQGSPYEYGYELHSYISGHRTESLSTLRPLLVSEHRDVNKSGHCKNYFASGLVPEDIKIRNRKFWKDLFSEEDYQVFLDDDMV